MPLKVIPPPYILREQMKNIICIKKCYDGKRVWEEGQTRNIDDSAPIPAHFKLSGTVTPPAPATRYNPMEPVVYKQNVPIVPKGGMAAGLKSAEILPMPTASSEAIRKASESKKQETSVLQPIIKTRGRPRKI